MTAAVGPVSGTRFAIGPTGTLGGSLPTSPDLFVAVGDISNLGNISQTFTEIAVESISSGDTYQLKGQRTFPNVTLTMNRNDSDAGQLALKSASAAARGTLYWFEIRETDGGRITWLGEVFGYGPSYGGVTALRSVQTSVSIRASSFTFTPSV
jgi:hypothetical protein